MACRCASTRLTCRCASWWCSTHTTSVNTSSAATGPTQRHREVRSAGAGGVGAVAGRSKAGFGSCSARQRLVSDAMWLGRVLALAPTEILDVFLVIALEPNHLRVAFEGEDVGSDAIEEPAIVRDHHRAAREGEQRLLERPQCLHVEIVGRLIEQQHVAPGAQHLGEVHAVTLAAG